MKRYLLFCWDCYYPTAGREQAKGDFDTIEEAVSEWERLGYDGYEILDLQERMWIDDCRERGWAFK